MRINQMEVIAPSAGINITEI